MLLRSDGRLQIEIGGVASTLHQSSSRNEDTSTEERLNLLSRSWQRRDGCAQVLPKAFADDQEVRCGSASMPMAAMATFHKSPVKFCFDSTF
jgi:hypothetical protein